MSPGTAAGLRGWTYAFLGETGEVLGTAFPASVLDSRRQGTYLLSAAHPALAAGPGDQVRVVGAGDRTHLARFVARGGNGEPDIGLLYVDETLGDPLPCSGAAPDGEVVLRGAASGLTARQGTFSGWTAGIEEIGGQPFLDIVLADIGFEWSDPRPAGVVSVAYAALRGLSGAPVCVGSRREGFSVCGVVVRRNTSGIANHVYAVPIPAVADFLARQGFVLHLSRARAAGTRVTDLLAGRLIRRLLNSSQGLHLLWDEVSELFYSGVPVDVELREAIQHPARYGFETGVQQAELQFLLARLLLKRGETAAAVRLLRQVGALARRDRNLAHRQLAALAGLREFMHSARSLSPAARKTTFELEIGRYEDVPGLSDGTRAYEVSSVLGSESAEWAMTGAFAREDPVARRHFRWMVDKHHALLRQFRADLEDKQDIVNLGLNTLMVLWDADERRNAAERASTLEVLAARGRVAAAQRSNAIFFTQALLAQAAAARLHGEPGTAFELLGLSAVALACADLGLDHEGVRALVFYFDQRDPLLAAVLRSVHSGGAVHAREVLPATVDFASRTERDALVGALRRCEDVERSFGAIADVFQLDGVRDR